MRLPSSATPIAERDRTRPVVITKFDDIRSTMERLERSAALAAPASLSTCCTRVAESRAGVAPGGAEHLGPGYHASGHLRPARRGPRQTCSCTTGWPNCHCLRPDRSELRPLVETSIVRPSYDDISWPVVHHLGEAT